jgi:hypothetical protein
MIRQECKEKLCAKLTSARYELEDALKLSTPAARYDPNILSEAMRTKVVSMISELNQLLQNLEGMQ